MKSGRRGTYVLALWLSNSRRISVGRLGDIEFPAGWYLYIGSAMGPGGLEARLARHQRTLKDGKRSHWHIDCLREYASWAGSWVRPSQQHLECLWAAEVQRLPEAQLVARGFGASDCRCQSHLVHTPKLPTDGWFVERLGARRTEMEVGKVEALLTILSAGDEDAREAAAAALGQLGSAAIDALTMLLASEDTDTRWWAARALAKVGGAGTVEPLVGVLADPNPDIRACAALALGHVGEGRAAPAVAQLLADESAFVSSIAADALSMIGSPAVDSLADVLAGQSPQARLLAVRVLGRTGSQRAVAPIFGALEDSSYLVRFYAQEALEALGVGMVLLKP